MLLATRILGRRCGLTVKEFVKVLLVDHGSTEKFVHNQQVVWKILAKS